MSHPLRLVQRIRSQLPAFINWRSRACCVPVTLLMNAKGDDRLLAILDDGSGKADAE
jgi:hypothetical protein